MGKSADYRDGGTVMITIFKPQSSRLYNFVIVQSFNERWRVTAPWWDRQLVARCAADSAPILLNPRINSKVQLQKLSRATYSLISESLLALWNYPNNLNETVVALAALISMCIMFLWLFLANYQVNWFWSILLTPYYYNKCKSVALYLIAHLHVA